jgi:DNA-3-methyladenine glycosylase
VTPALLGREFFRRPSQDVGPALLGCVLESWSDDGLVAVRLTETEAYAGETDPASHAFHGRTARNAVMYGEPGHAYVYFTYGMHFCVNLVCYAPDSASAVLLRAGEVVAGLELAARRRLAAHRRAAARSGAARVADRDLARGPGRLCQAMGIDRALDGADACDPGGPLRIRAGDAGEAGDAGVAEVCQGPRVGVSRAAEVPWRYWLAGDRTVSPYRAHTPKRRGNPSARP